MNEIPNKKIAQGYLLPYTKMTGLFHLSTLHSEGFPCADIQMLPNEKKLPKGQLFIVRTAVASGNDFYLPSVWGVTAEEIERWRNKKVDLMPYSIDIPDFRYSFGLHRYPTPEERRANRYKRLKDIKELQFFYHPYFNDARPFGVRGRIALYPVSIMPEQAIIEIVKPRSLFEHEREMKAMQEIVETIYVT